MTGAWKKCNKCAAWFKEAACEHADPNQLLVYTVILGLKRKKRMDLSRCVGHEAYVTPKLKSLS